MVFHQYHESKRDMDACMAALQGSSYGPQRSREIGGLYAIYNHGHRERAEDGRLGGILADHIARYRFASRYSHDKTILDVPCGTGYGRAVLTNAREYIGVDIDAESVQFARDNYKGAEWRVGAMENLPVPDNSIDMVTSFEGIEHIEDPRAFVNEMYRVLKNGGTFIVSTPQKGAARGTPWDRFILTTDEFYSLFEPTMWKNVDWFYQQSYADPADPKEGRPPSTAEIMILGGTAIKEKP
jgi:SAM-dependent methyltransferase